MEYLFIRNKLLQTWLLEPLNELTPEKAQSAVHLPHPGTVAVCVLALQHDLFSVAISVFKMVGLVLVSAMNPPTCNSNSSCLKLYPI